MYRSKDRILVVLLILCAVLMTVGIVYIRMLEDRTAPVINLEGAEDFIYEQDSEDERLLAGITAVDDVDGDVTDSIIISDITYLNDTECVIVYAAKDASDNVTTVRRKIDYVKTVGYDDSYYQKLRAEQLKKGEPYLRLTVHGTYIKKNTGIDFQSFVQEAVDTVGNDIRQNLEVRGSYDLTKTGVYEIEIRVVDQNGNVSNIEEFSITVE